MTNQFPALKPAYYRPQDYYVNVKTSWGFVFKAPSRGWVLEEAYQPPLHEQDALLYENLRRQHAFYDSQDPTDICRAPAGALQISCSSILPST